MAKKEKKTICEEMPPWMITFSDVMTLMLTFFVLLVSMARIDERRKLVVLGSIFGTFGFNPASPETLTTKSTGRTIEPGPMNDAKDLKPLQGLKWEEISQDFRFESSRFVQTLSINADVLFNEGDTTLSGTGIEQMDKLLPLLRQVKYPLLIAGHTATVRDELGEQYQPGDEDQPIDLSWRISLGRSLAVYRYLIDNGMDPDMLRMEGFGKFKNVATNTTAEGRRFNRRVDIVLDKRSMTLREEMNLIRTEAPKPDPDGINVNGFRFDVSQPDLDNAPEAN